MGAIRPTSFHRGDRALTRGATRALVSSGLALALLACACAKEKPTAPPPAGTRSYRMGFSGLPSRPDQVLAVQEIQMWGLRADAAIWHEEPPWQALLAGASADSLVRANFLGLAQYYRGHGLALVFEIDPTNGLNRSVNADSLVAHGQSIGMPYVQAAFRRWAAAVDTILVPDDLGLACEVNLVRVAAPDSLYQAEKQLARSTADLLRAMHAARPVPHAGRLYATIQVDLAWGRLGGPGVYQGAATELADFSWADRVGLSAYPYLAGFDEPDLIPTDYFARIARDAGKPVMVIEGGWTSASLASAAVTSSPAKQARYVRRMTSLLDAAGATAWFQLEFADLDLASFPPQPPGSILPLFATLGFTDPDMNPKPALEPWDSAFAKARVP